MSTDSGNEDSGESGQQSEKASKGKGFLGIFVFLIAVGGVVLIVVSGQDPSIPQIEGYGGNQNPFVGIPNVAIGAMGIFETFMYLIAGGILLAVALVVALIRNKNGRRSSSQPVAPTVDLRTSGRKEGDGVPTGTQTLNENAAYWRNHKPD
jgi:hypothetical protein